MLSKELFAILGRSLVAFDYQKLTVTDTAQAVTVPSGALYMEARLESTEVGGVAARYKLLGNDNLPTSTDGIGLCHLDMFDLTGGDNVKQFRIIKAVEATTVLHVQFYR